MRSSTAPAHMKWLPGDDEISRYGAEGFLVTPRVVPEALLDAAWSAIEAFLSSGSTSLDPIARASDLRRSAGDAMDHVGYLYLELPEVRALVEGARVAAIAALLAHTPAIRLFHDRLLVKPPSGGGDAAIGWHVDRAYWFGCTSDDMLTAWIPFADVGEDMGPLTVLPGSHRWDAPLMATSHRKDMDALLCEIAEGRDAAPRALTMRRGQMSLHHCRTVHGSMPNRGTAPRAALAVHLQTDGNRRRRVVLPDGRELAHTNDTLCRTGPDGLPDYEDPAVFPELWREKPR